MISITLPEGGQWEFPLCPTLFDCLEDIFGALHVVYCVSPVESFAASNALLEIFAGLLLFFSEETVDWEI